MQQPLSWVIFTQSPIHAVAVCAEALSNMQGVSLQQRVDPFSGAATGTAAAASRTNAAEDASP